MPDLTPRLEPDPAPAPAPAAAFDPDCPLCEAARITPWFHEDEICWIAECTICATPMVVWRSHGVDPSPEARAHMLAKLGHVASTELGEHWVDGNMRNIPDHFHAHSRPAGGFFGPRSTRR